jgi:hypothetical protein
VADWLINPTPRPIARQRGDLDSNGAVNSNDIVLLLNCVFVDSSGPGCNLTYADMNCDGVLTSADVTIHLNLAFLGTLPEPDPCGSLANFMGTFDEVRWKKQRTNGPLK